MGHLRARHSRAAYVASAASLPDPYTIFGASLIHEWDLSLSTVTVATGISSVSDLRGGKNLTQGTGSKQPAFTSAGLVSKSTSIAANQQHLMATGMSYSGDFTVIGVYGYTATAGSTYPFAAIFGSTTKLFATINGALNFRAVFDDATGQDIVIGGAPDTVTRAWALRNATGVSRKFYSGGGAGVSGARTLDIDACNGFTLHSGNQFGNYSSTDCYWMGIVAPSPSLADLNRWGAWAAARFASVGVTWSTAT